MKAEWKPQEGITELKSPAVSLPLFFNTVNAFLFVCLFNFLLNSELRSTARSELTYNISLGA